jgi:AraC family transcriptional regulator
MASNAYIARINRVIDHIERHLDQPLPLRELSRVASFSPYHFHRIFSAMVGETLNAFIGRLRLERAASQLLHAPDKPVTDVALDCGFSSSATFARAFKAHFGVSASAYRKIGKTNRNEEQTLRNPCEAYAVSAGHLDPTTHNWTWRIEMKKNEQQPEQQTMTADVEVKELDPVHVAYVRHVGPYKGDAALFGRLWGQIMKWAAPRGLIQPETTKCLSVYHDDPEITDDDKLRVSICISVPEGTKVEGEVGEMTVPGGTFAVARFELADDEYAAAWAALYGGWLPESGFQPDDRPAYELCLNDPKQHPQGKAEIAICVPVKPL